MRDSLPVQAKIVRESDDEVRDLLPSILPRMFRLALLTALCIASASAQPVPFDAEARRAIVDTVADRFLEAYSFPDVAAAVAADLRARADRGDYADLDEPAAFADSLSDHLAAVTRDRHVRVDYSAEPVTAAMLAHEPTGDELAAHLADLRRVNYGVYKAERLAGNVGYLDLRWFIPPELGEATEAVAAAMTVLAHTDALLVDLRQNRGGSPVMVQLLASYLLGPEPVRLTLIHYRAEDRTDVYETLPSVDGPWYGTERPVYVLAGPRTASAAEEFAYDLQALGRVTVVGETTYGAANPGGTVRLTDHFRVFVPTGVVANAVTGGNWEGVGVTPDLAVPSDDALRAAHRTALERLLNAATDAGVRDELADALRDAR